jgi:hypothetical protein
MLMRGIRVAIIVAIACLVVGSVVAAPDFTAAATANGIAQRWTSEAESRGYDVDSWRADTVAALQRLDHNRFVQAEQAKSYAEFVRAVTGKSPVQFPEAGGIVPAALGTNSDNLAFHPINPCRIVDTRFGTGTFLGKRQPGTTTSYSSSLSNYSSQGGIGTACPGQISEAGALAYTVFVFDYTASGFVTVFPYTATLPNASTINYGLGTSDVVLANSSVVQQCYLCGPEFNVYVFAGGSAVNVIVDVIGYYDPGPPNYFVRTGLNTTSLNATSTFQKVGGDFLTFAKTGDSSSVEVVLHSRALAGTFAGAFGVFFQIRIDGLQPNVETQAALTTSGANEFISITAVFTGLAPGNHTVSVWARTNAGTSTGVLLDPGGWNGGIIAKEVF